MKYYIHHNYNCNLEGKNFLCWNILKCKYCTVVRWVIATEAISNRVAEITKIRIWIATFPISSANKMPNWRAAKSCWPVDSRKRRRWSTGSWTILSSSRPVCTEALSSLLMHSTAPGNQLQLQLNYTYPKQHYSTTKFHIKYHIILHIVNWII